MNDNGEGAGSEGGSNLSPAGSHIRTPLSSLQTPRGRIVLTKHIWTDARKEFRQVFGKAGTDVIMYQLGKAYGCSLAKQLFPGKYSYDEEGYEQFRALLLGLAEAIGWGEVGVEVKEAEGEVSLALKNCVFCEYSRSEKGICFEMAGLLAGFTEVVTRRSFVVSELKCIAAGEQACTFLIKFR